VKLIAEPWDVGQGGYQVGNFPPLWSEWNGKYRDTVRDFWRGQSATLPEFASRLTGSSDLYEASGRRPVASVNFVTAHDGFTLADLVAYNNKHNEANGEENRDGSDDNRSWNCGAEGPTDDPAILALRARQQRNFLTTLLLSQGIPMLLHGDEFGRTQRGNNNVYCQDNEISWLDWGHQQEGLAEFTAWLVRLRREHPVFRRRRFFQGQDIRGRQHELDDITWLTPSGEEMTDEDWEAGFAKSLGVFLNGDAIGEPDTRGQRVTSGSFLLLFNASEQEVQFTIPPPGYGERWTREIDTARSLPEAGDVTTVKAGDRVPLISRSLQVLRRA
jgi:glycogen operon protein